MNLKCQFHIHVKGDPHDHISYETEDIIDLASRLGYNVLSITCHRKVLFEEKWRKYAKNKNIILIPGIEFEIGERHVLCINAHKEIENVKTFKELKNYKKNHPESLIIAPHAFFPGKTTLKKSLIENIEIFDAIEISWAYTKHINFNREAIKIGKKYNKPLIATSDLHVLSQLKKGGYCIIKSDFKIDSIIKSIKQNKVKNFHKPSSIYKIAKFFILLSMYRLYCIIRSTLSPKRKNEYIHEKNRVYCEKEPAKNSIS